jgi:hypothetical protein
MANNAMRAKVERAQRQAREAIEHVRGVELYHVAHHTTPSKAESRTLIAAALATNPTIKRIPNQGIMPREAFSVTGKGNRAAFKRCYGDGRRLGAAVVWARG